LPTYEEGYMLLDVPLATHTTPATLIGRNLELLIVGFTLSGIGIAGLGEYRRRSGRGSGANRV